MRHFSYDQLKKHELIKFGFLDIINISVSGFIEIHSSALRSVVELNGSLQQACLSVKSMVRKIKIIDKLKKLNSKTKNK
jgi:hypothetical protein